MTRMAMTRCVRCGHEGRAIVANLALDAVEPVTISCGWVNEKMCAASQARRVSELCSKEPK